ncbi:hypothetical protein F5Y12DRAFT_222298 [Xylaria sp. FL1777]|nr:hypothetical protein F5Y12DRAFT_222298 [Xylaria sp. FL1777]
MSSQPDSPNNLPPAPPGVLKIANAPEDIVRAVLIALCQDPVQEKKVMSYFVKLEELRSEGEGIDASTSTNEQNNDGGRTNAKGPKKRMAISEIGICELCKEPFSADDNRSNGCRYHPGYMEVNDDASTWDDWEDWREGDPELEENKEEYPEGYRWNCCQQSGESVGCTRGQHVGLYKKPYDPSVGMDE